MRIVFIGPPGVGKGTQSKRLVAAYQIPHISTGEMLRAAIEQGTEAGKISAGFIDQGHLAPDSLVLALVEERLQQSDCERGYLLDGFPRTITQAQGLDQYLQARETPLSVVLELKVETALILERLAARGRDDDRPDVIRQRLERYAEQTAPLADFYRQKNLLQEIDGIGTPDEVFGRIQQVLMALPG